MHFVDQRKPDIFMASAGRLGDIADHKNREHHA